MSDEFKDAMANLAPRKAAFVKHYLEHGNGAQAAIAAGYSPRRTAAKSRAWVLLNRDDKVMRAVKLAQHTLADATQYDAQAAMKELETAMQFARDTNNATALARCIELRAKLTGLMIERHHVETGEGSLAEALETARARVAAAKTIEGEKVEAPALEKRTSEKPANDPHTIKEYDFLIPGRS